MDSDRDVHPWTAPRTTSRRLKTGPAGYPHARIQPSTCRPRLQRDDNAVTMPTKTSKTVRSRLHLQRRDHLRLQ